MQYWERLSQSGNRIGVASKDNLLIAGGHEVPEIDSLACGHLETHCTAGQPHTVELTVHIVTRSHIKDKVLNWPRSTEHRRLHSVKARTITSYALSFHVVFI